MSQLIKITTTPIKLAFKVEQGQYQEVKPDMVDINSRRVQAVVAAQQSQAAQTYRPQQHVAAQPANTDAVRISNTIKATIPVDISSLNSQVLDQINNNSNNGGKSTVSAAKMVQHRVTQKTSQNVAYVSGTGDAAKWQPDQNMVNMDVEIDTSALNDPTFKYVPGSIQVTVEQYPTIEIEYLGGPQYVPASSDPNFKGDK